MLETIFWFVLVLGLLVFVHELGHFILAKLWGITVEEFGIGYPPRLFKIAEIHGTEYTINLLPLGGFVRLAGEEDPSVPGSFASKSRLARATTLVAGSAMNLLLGIAIYTAIFTIGAPVPTPDKPGVGIYEVEPGSPADKAGLRVGDTILQIDDLKLGPGAVKDLKAYVDAHAGQPVRLIVERDGKVLEPIVLVPRVRVREDQGAMGVRIGEALARKSYPLFTSLGLAMREAVRVVILTFEVIGDVLRGLIPLGSAVAGPVGIAQATGEVARFGPIWLMNFTALLSVNLALINLLPFPALDGGRLIFVILEALRGGRRIDPRKERLVHVIGMAVLLSLMLFVSYLDLVRIFNGGSFLGQ